METNWKLRERLAEIISLAQFEQKNPTGLHLTCLSVIERNAKAALQDLNNAAGSDLTPTPPHLKMEDAGQ